MNRTLAATLLFLGLSLNPWTLAYLFSHNGRVESWPFLTAILLTELGLIALGIAVLRNKYSWADRLGLSALGGILALAMAVAADRAYGAFMMPDRADLLFPSFSRAFHRTAEFDLWIRINNLGFRGPDAHFGKSRSRAMLIGDSFTFGWGVEERESWAGILADSFPGIEVLNLGQGGNHPGDYVRTVRKALPLLRPDVVIVGVLQGNDVHQLGRMAQYERDRMMVVIPPKAKGETTAETLGRYMQNVFPHLTQRIRRPVYMQHTWEQEARAILNMLDEGGMARYHAIDTAIQRVFEAGLLNPTLVFEAIYYPDNYAAAADTSTALGRAGMLRMRGHMRELDSLCAAHGAQLITVSMPYRPYGCPPCAADLARFGYSLAGTDTVDADAAFAYATEGLRAERIVLTDSFHPRDSAFYPLDGHWNAEGNRIFARALIARLKHSPAWNSSLTSGSF